jgi:hypothetical protein
MDAEPECLQSSARVLTDRIEKAGIFKELVFGDGKK